MCSMVHVTVFYYLTPLLSNEPGSRVRDTVSVGDKARVRARDTTRVRVRIRVRVRLRVRV